MKARRIPLKMYPRYVGNRMHIIFHLAGVTLFLREDLEMFLVKYAKPCGGLTAALAKDLKDPLIVQHLHVLALYGKILTGPWMFLFYTEEHSNLEMVPEIRKCVADLEHLLETPSDIFTTKEDIFGKVLCLESDPVLASLKELEQPDDELVKAVATEMVQLLKRQLKMYLSGEFSSEEQKLARSAPVHNMQAERIMAMIDSQKRRAPNAKLDFVEAKVKFKSNNSIAWLQQQPANEREKLVKFAISRSRQVTKEKQKKQEQVHEEIIERMEQKQRKRSDATRRAMEKKVRQMECGPAEVTAAQVEELATENNLPSDVQAALLDLLLNPADFVGRDLLHTWYDGDTKADVTYFGQVHKLKKTKICTFVISYRQLNEEPDAEVDFDITRNQIITDLIFQDISL